jgi:hypothetical protein
MSARILHRLNQLERARALAPGQCPLCGTRPKQLKVVFGDDPDDGSPTHCPNCGRSLYIVVEFDPLGDEVTGHAH